MASQVEIANRALSKLGEARITSVSDNNPEAKAVSARWDTLRDAALTENPWRFAIELVQLVADSTAPTHGYSYRYRRPSDDLWTVQVGDYAAVYHSLGVLYRYSTAYDPISSPYEVVGQYIHTDLSAPLNYQYVKRVENTGEWDALFVEAFACRLAMDMCEELTQSASKMDRVAAMYKDAMKQAVRRNALLRPPQERSTGKWFGARVAHG